MSHTTLGTFSSSSGSGQYDVKLDNSSGKLWCDCRGWKMKREGQPYHCRHTDEVRDRLTLQGWAFELRFDENYYVTRRQDTGQAFPSLAAAAATAATRAINAARAVPLPPGAQRAPSLEEVRKAGKKPGYEVVRRTRRNISGE